jgi:hypothetical protein
VQKVLLFFFPTRRTIRFRKALPTSRIGLYERKLQMLAWLKLFLNKGNNNYKWIATHVFPENDLFELAWANVNVREWFREMFKLKEAVSPEERTYL